jgi:hypothetical protein
MDSNSEEKKFENLISGEAGIPTSGVLLRAPSPGVCLRLQRHPNTVQTCWKKTLPLVAHRQIECTWTHAVTARSYSMAAHHAGSGPVVPGLG